MHKTLRTEFEIFEVVDLNSDTLLWNIFLKNSTLWSYSGVPVHFYSFCLNGYINMTNILFYNIVTIWKWNITKSGYPYIVAMLPQYCCNMSQYSNNRSVFYSCTFWTGTHGAISWSEVNICLFHFNLLHRVYQLRECRNKKQI